MPWGDGTGPRGFGPMTGRGAGYCAGYDVPGYMNPVPGGGFSGRGAGRGFGRGMGRGFGRRMGRGFGWRAQFAPAVPVQPGYGYPVQPARLTRQSETEMLKSELDAIHEELKGIEAEKLGIEKRLKELKQLKD